MPDMHVRLSYQLVNRITDLVNLTNPKAGKWLMPLVFLIVAPNSLRML